MKNNGFIENNNYKLVYEEQGYAVLEADITDTSLNHYKTAHGFGRNAMTVNANIEYLHAITSKKIKAEAKCIKNGKTISVFDVDIIDLERDRVAAKSTVTYFYID